MAGKIITNSFQNKFLNKEEVYFEWFENIQESFKKTLETKDLDCTDWGERFIDKSFTWSDSLNLDEDKWSDLHYLYVKEYTDKIKEEKL